MGLESFGTVEGPPPAETAATDAAAVATAMVTEAVANAGAAPAPEPRKLRGRAAKRARDARYREARRAAAAAPPPAPPAPAAAAPVTPEEPLPALSELTPFLVEIAAKSTDDARILALNTTPHPVTGKPIAAQLGEDIEKLMEFYQVKPTREVMLWGYLVVSAGVAYRAVTTAPPQTYAQARPELVKPAAAAEGGSH